MISQRVSLDWYSFRMTLLVNSGLNSGFWFLYTYLPCDIGRRLHVAFVGRGIILLVNMTNVDVFGSYQSSMLVFVFVVHSWSILQSGL